LHVRNLLLGSREGIAGAVYGTVVVMATIAAGAKGGLSAWTLLATMTGTVVVLWIAHVYAAALEHSIEHDRRLRWREITAVAFEERSILLSGTIPGLALALGGIEVWKASTAAWVALGAGLVVLAVQGFRYAQVERLGLRGTVVAVGVNLGLGLVIVALKAAVSH
jgi:DMSO reductase anchor subunit